MISASKFGDWEKLGDILNGLPAKVDRATKKALKKEGQFLRNKMVQGIKDQEPGGQRFTPLAPTTIAVRQFKGFSGTKALIRSGDLRNSIQAIDVQEGVFIGVHRTAKNKAGKSLLDIAIIHEQGAGPIVIKVTPKMRAFLMAAFRQAGLQGPYGKGSGVILSKIPARPFVGPVFEKFSGTGSRDRIEAEMVRLLTGVIA